MSRVTQPPTWSKRLGFLVSLCPALSLLVAASFSIARAAGLPRALDAGTAEPSVPLAPVQGPPSRPSAISDDPSG